MGAAVQSRKYGFVPLVVMWLVPLLLTLAPAAAHAIKCTKPEDLCSGDPCVIRQVEVASPCSLDFGDRTLVIGGTLSVPNGGTLDLRARDIEVRRAIIGRHATPFAGNGASVSLNATNDIIVRWRIDVSGRLNPGVISLNADGDVQVLAPLRAAANGTNPVAPGGGIFITAGGRITASGRARMRAEGGTNTPGGSIALAAGSGVRLENRVGADGRDGGSVAVTTLAGDVFTARQLSASGLLGTGGSVVTFAQAGSVIMADNIEAQGITGGGTIFTIAGKALVASGHLRARANPNAGTGGTVVVSGGTLVSLQDTVYADGARGGSIQVMCAGGDLHTVAPLIADGSNGAGGSISLSAGKVMTVDSQCDTDGRTQGGEIVVNGLTVVIDNRAELFARGAQGGTVTVTGDQVSVNAAARVLVDGDEPSGSIKFDARVGDLTLSGRFRARGIGGSIEGSAARGVFADGEFEAAGAGCIGLSAGTTLDISSGSFDVPVTASCP
jgi:hypothetical protein